MKNLVSILLVLILISSFGCTALKENKDLAFRIGKEISVEALKELFELTQADFEQNKVEVKGNFDFIKVERLLGKLVERFTERGTISFENLKVQTYLKWAYLPDTQEVYIEYYRLKLD
jgi:hypothetical protein